MSAVQIIVCDDNEDIREILSLSLKQAGYAPLEAGCAKEVFEYVAKEQPKLILLDITMPDQDGLAIAETLMRQGANLPIIFITAHDQSIRRIAADTLGAAAFFTKPIDIEKLIAKIGEVLRERAKA